MVKLTKAQKEQFNKFGRNEETAVLVAKYGIGAVGFDAGLLEIMKQCSGLLFNQYLWYAYGNEMLAKEREHKQFMNKFRAAAARGEI